MRSLAAPHSFRLRASDAPTHGRAGSSTAHGTRDPRFPARITTESATGLRVSWVVYLGAGPVRFDPPQTEVWEDSRDGEDSPWSPGWSAPKPPPDGRWGARATFDEPGTYLLQVQAHDGGLSTTEAVTVTVRR